MEKIIPKADKFTDAVFWTGILIFVAGMAIIAIRQEAVLPYLFGIVVLITIPIGIRNFVIAQRKIREQEALPPEEKHEWKLEKWLGARCTKCNMYSNFPTHMNWPAKCPGQPQEPILTGTVNKSTTGG